jgi:uncharacterized membrane protein (DUF106 family)
MFALLNAIDDFCSFMPEALRLALYGLLLGVAAMLIYRLISPQKKLKAIKHEMAQARSAMRSYDGTDPREMLRLSGKAIAPALRQLLLVLGPTIIAAAPVALVVWWLESTKSQVWSFGPTWMHTWHTPFMAALTVAALGMKFALKIH